MIRLSLGLILGFINLLSLLVFAADKGRARERRWRISEGHLLLWTLCGPLGAALGIWWLRHKTRSPAFLCAAVTLMLTSLVMQVLALSRAL